MGTQIKCCHQSVRRLVEMGQGQSTIEGTVAPGYESVKELFEENFRTGRETSAQLCVYVGEEKVVDLWGSIKDKDFSGDSITNVFSSTKSLAAIALASLVDRGLLNYSDKICKHWPEFGQNGKEDVTVADLMRHEAGLASFDTSLTPEDFSREGIKANKVGEVVARQGQDFPPDGNRRQYHAVTRGWVINEIFRFIIMMAVYLASSHDDAAGESIRPDLQLVNTWRAMSASRSRQASTSEGILLPHTQTLSHSQRPMPSVRALYHRQLDGESIQTSSRCSNFSTCSGSSRTCPKMQGSHQL